MSTGSKISHTSTSIALNAIITHLLWSTLYVMYISYLRLLIWGRKRLMNFLSIWRLFSCFLHGMYWLQNLADFQFIPRSQGLSTEFIPRSQGLSTEWHARNSDAAQRLRKRNTESNISDRKLKNFTTLHNLVKSRLQNSRFFSQNQ